MAELLLFFDGCCRGNGTPSAVGGFGWVVVRGDDGVILGQAKGPAGKGAGVTVHTAEYVGLLSGLSWLVAQDLGDVDTVEIRGDDQVVIRQVAGVFECGAPHLRALRNEARALAGKLARVGCSVSVRWVPRDENARADRLSHEALDEAREDGDGYDGDGDPVALPVALG
jgi:ribonuclease HI